MSTQNNGGWVDVLLDAFAAEDITFLPFLPDGVLAPLVVAADAREGFTLVPLTREEEGVGIAAGAAAAGRRTALVCQVSGIGNSLNAIGSVVMAQRIPLLLLVSERGGLGETVSTQIPFGGAFRRILDSMGIPWFDVDDVDRIPALVRGAAALCYTSRTVVALILTPAVAKEGA
jgi:sulfopyruvate decarboxylase subunit alpha